LPASTPVLFVIDGDPGAAHALRDDLSRRFGREFRIVWESAADAGWRRSASWPSAACRWHCSSSARTWAG
jgi:hypothetical protein